MDHCYVLTLIWETGLGGGGGNFNPPVGFPLKNQEREKL